MVTILDAVPCYKTLFGKTQSDSPNQFWFKLDK